MLFVYFTITANAMTFFHIPLIESYSLPIDLGLKGRLMMGERLEGSGAAKSEIIILSSSLFSRSSLTPSFFVYHSEQRIFHSSIIIPRRARRLQKPFRSYSR